MTEADDDLLVLDAPTDVRLGLVRRLVALLHLEGDLVRTTVLRAAQRTNRAGDARVHVRAGPGDDTRRERRGVELVLGVQVQRDVHRLDPALRGRPAMQQVQEVPADRLVVGLDVDPHARVAVVVPVGEHRAEARHQAVGDVPGAGEVVVFLLGQRAAEHRDAGAQHVHRMARGGQRLERGADRNRQAAQALQLDLVARELSLARQLAVHQKVGHFLEFAGLGEIEDVVTPVVQVVTTAPDGAERGVAGGDAGQGDGFLRLEAWGLGIAHGCLLAVLGSEMSALTSRGPPG